MYNDTSFIDLTRPEVLSMIDIDERLKPAFINMMYRLQRYFNKHNYTKNFNYRLLFNDYLLTSNLSKRFRIMVSNEPSKIGCAGFYSADENRIVIDSKILNSKELEKILCHEFIHFLTMHYLIKCKIYNEKTKEIFNGGFINEALAEMLTLEIYPECKLYSGYAAQVRMMNYANQLCGSINLYQCFLLGYIDISVLKNKKKNRFAKSYETDFYKYITNYQKHENSFSYEDALMSNTYVNAQRSLILSVLETINDIGSYTEFLKKVINSPVPDYDFLVNALLRKEKELIDKLGIQDLKFKKELLSKLTAMRANMLIYYQSFFELPFRNGTVYYNDNNDYVIFVNSTPHKNLSLLNNVRKYINYGVYRFYYNIGNISYTITIDKKRQYDNLEMAKESFYNQLKAVKSDGSIRSEYYEYKDNMNRKIVVGVIDPEYGLRYEVADYNPVTRQLTSSPYNNRKINYSIQEIGHRR